MASGNLENPNHEKLTNGNLRSFKSFLTDFLKGFCYLLLTNRAILWLLTVQYSKLICKGKGKCNNRWLFPLTCKSSFLALISVFHNRCACMLSHFSSVWLFATLWTVACLALLSMGFSRQEYWIGLPCPPPGGPPDPGIEPTLLRLLHWQARSLPIQTRLLVIKWWAEKLNYKS